MAKIESGRPRKQTFTEKQVHSLMQQMLSNTDWLIPIATAQRTYRSVYYGMTATALLEDVHFDAMSNWISKFAPTITLEKPSRGAKAPEGDYVINSLAVSHKSMDGPASTGVHWDALVAAKRSDSGAPGLWSSTTPMMVISAKHEKLTAEIYDGPRLVGTVRAIYPAAKKPPGRKSLALVSWGRDIFVVHHLLDSVPDFSEFWLQLSLLTSKGLAPNEVDLAWVPNELVPQRKYRVAPIVRAGCFVLSKAQLTNIKLGQNNRASLIMQDEMRRLLSESESQGRFTPIPLWPSIYAGVRPPDLFLGLKAQFDDRFSPVRLD